MYCPLMIMTSASCIFKYSMWTVVSSVALIKYSVPGGLDIRDSAGTSVGARKPIASGNTKNETMPISGIMLSMSDKDLAMFVEHWQDATSSDVDAALETAGGATGSTPNSTQGFFPASSFEASRSKRSLSMTSKSLRKPDHASHLSAVKTTLPVNPGDLLWLIDQFLDEHIPNGGEVDLASGSEHRNLVYQLISTSVLRLRTSTIHTSRP